MRRYIDIRKDTTSRWDAFWYAVVYGLGRAQHAIIRFLIRDAVWRAYNNRVYSMRTLSDQHLFNIIRMIERDAVHGVLPPPEYEALVREQRRRLALLQPPPSFGDYS